MPILQTSTASNCTCSVLSDCQLKCGFCKKLLLCECNYDQLSTFFILSSLLAKQQQTHPKLMTEWKKWATGQSCICKEVTSYKIHTLVPTQLNFDPGNNKNVLEFSVFSKLLWSSVALINWITTWMVHVARQNGTSLNQSRQPALKNYCPNIYTVSGGVAYMQ